MLLSRNHLRRLVAGLLAATLGLAACAPARTSGPSTGATEPPPSPGTSAVALGSVAPATPTASLDHDAGWRADLAALIPGMAAIHPRLTHSTSRATLDAAVAALSARVGTATDDELLAGVLRIVAMVSAAGCDAHTGASVWGSGTYPVDTLPLRVWLFPSEIDGEAGDEVVIVDALAPYEALIGARIDSVGGHPIADVLARIAPIVPRDNDQTLRLLTPRFLLIPQVLRGLGLAGPGPVRIGATTKDGTAVSIDVAPVPMAAYNAWAGPYGLHLPADPTVLYLSRIDDLLWWQLLPDGETLYVQDNRIDPVPQAQLDKLKTALHAPGVARVVLDLRHNYGGELSALDPVVQAFEDPAVARPDGLFVITGRNTFSGGSLLVARLDHDTPAQVIGEPMGGCPTFFSDPTDLVLPNTGITVGVADDVAIGVDPDDPRQTIQPDVAAILTREDFASGRDPALALFETLGP
jgi:hypothetical protein